MTTSLLVLKVKVRDQGQPWP